MHTLTTLPLDSFVTAAFAELLADVTGLLESTKAQKPIDRDELKFWQAQFNALNKAEAYWTQGVRPVIAANAYLIASASRPGALVHRLTRHGGILVCSCEAGVKGTLCWHHMLCNVLERASELESLTRKEAELVSGSGNDPQSGLNPIPHAAEAAAWLGGQQQLHTRLAATDAYLATLRAAQIRSDPQHISQHARAAYARANQPSPRRPLFADRDAETFRRQALAEERAVLLAARARRAA